MTEPRSKNRTRWPIIVGGIIAVAVICVALLPTVLSSQWGKGRVLSMAAPHLPGEIQVDSWSLSWFGSQRIGGIRYADQSSGLQADTAEVTVAKGLASFLLDRGDLGTVTIVRPDIRILLPEPPPEEGGSEPEPRPQSSPPGRGTPEVSEKDAQPGQEPLA
ncbi:MAG: hypothetical protein P8X86_21495, partial [Desulfofustis sp.]